MRHNLLKYKPLTALHAGKRGPEGSLSISEIMMTLVMFTQFERRKRTNYYIDSSCLPTCLLKHSKRHKIFAWTVQYSRTSISWFFGLKLHIMTNVRDKLMALKITQDWYTHHCFVLNAMARLVAALAVYAIGLLNFLYNPYENLKLKLKGALQIEAIGLLYW